MKTKISFAISFFLLFFLCNVTVTKSQIFHAEWNADNGIPYHQSFDLNTGFNAFIFLNDGNIAFLLKQDCKIRIFNSLSGEKIRDIAIPSGVIDFCHDNRNLYLLLKDRVTRIALIVGETKNYKLKNNNNFEKISVISGKIYLYTNNNQTWKFSPKNTTLIPVSNDHLYLQKNMLASTEKKSSHSFSLQINGLKKTYNTVGKLASASLAGCNNENLYIDVQYIIHEVPLEIEREIWVISFDAGRFSEGHSTVKIPDCYYIHVKNDVLVNSEGAFYSLTSPAGVEILKIEEGIDITILELYKGYHFNFHLAKSKEENDLNAGLQKAPITRTEIINNAEPYETHTWYCNASNIKDYQCGGKQVVTPSWVTAGNHNALPYMWGGWSNLTQFDQGLLNNVSAGDCNTNGGGAGSSCAVGVDCSGFVSRAWSLSSKYGTSTLPNISTAYASFNELLPGDIVNYAGHHVRLIHTLNTNGTFYMIESSASGTDWRVGYNTYSAVNLQGTYIPRYYNDVITVVPDTIPPFTTIQTNNWHTGNFNVNFTDTDNSGIQALFWLPAELENSNWVASEQNGFLYDDFNNNITPSWTLIEPSWTIGSGTINQSNEALTQNNAYTTLIQDSTSAYLYQWKMKLSGSGTDKRAGIYIFSDSATAVQRNNAYMIYYRADLDLCQIYKSMNNTITLMTEDPCTIDETSWFDCKVIYDPLTGTITAYLNNEPITSWTDDAPLKGGKYLSLRTGACSALFDEFRVYRSRGNVANITTGGVNGLINSQNPNPGTPACKIFSAAIDLADNFRLTNITTNIDFSIPNTVTEIADISFPDVDTLHVLAPITARWNPSSDLNSGIIGYKYALGTSAGLDDILPWTFSTDTQAVCTSFLPIENLEYFFSVKGVNTAGLESYSSSSDGFMLATAASIVLPESNNSLLFFPVPASEAVHFIFSKNEICELKVTDVSGRIMQRSMITGATYSLDAKEYKSGLYFFTLKNLSDNIINKGKFVIVK